jgi:C-terminal processing protease CtpA/Prc
MRPFICGILFLSIGLCSANGIDPPSAPAQKLSQADFEADFDYLWKGFQEHYAYFDKKATNWNKVKRLYRPRLANVKTREEFIAVLELVLEELYDPHAIVNTNTASSPRLVPAGADIWAEWRKGQAIITEVRPGSNAERAGIKAGMEVVSINGVAVEKAVDDRMGKCLRNIDLAAKNYVLRVLLAGRHNEERRLELRADEKPKTFAIDDRKPSAGSSGKAPALLEQKRLGEKPGIGYVRLNNSLGSIELVKEFDAALAQLQDTRGLILDLRDTPNGGNTTVARGIMGRFIERDEYYHKHSFPSEERRTGIRRSWVELVSPRGPRYSGPVVVLVNHWTASMGEGLAIGMDAIKGGKIVGTAMAGLAGQVHTITLPNSKIEMTFPAEKVFHVNGTPREDFVPPVCVDLLSPESQKSQDPILDAGLKTLNAPIK